MITEAKAKNIITNKLIEYCRSKNYDYSLPNHQYVGEVLNPVIGLYFMSSSFTDIFLNRVKRLNGLLQINISVPKGEGTYNADMIKEDLIGIYNIGNILSHNGDSIHITNVYGSGNITSDVMYVDTLTVEYKEFTN